MRLGFGQSRINDLIDFLNTSKCYEKQEEYVYAIGLLKEYISLHERENFQLPDSFNSKLKEFVLNYSDIESFKQIKMSDSEYFIHFNASFPIFAKSRHSVRDFAGPADISNIIKSVELQKMLLLHVIDKL